MVAGRFFLLVAAFLLLVDDDQTEIFNWCEDGGTGTDDHASFTVADSPPFTRALDIPKRGMKDGNSFKARAEPGSALTADPECKRNFRNQKDGGFTPRERVLHAAEIDFGFAAAGNAMQELYAELAEFE